MGRNSKQNCDYFPLDCHVDDKLKIIKYRFGMEGYGILIALYQLIYSNGYFVEFGEEEQIIFCGENQIDDDKLTTLIQHCINKNLFSVNIYTKYGVLTSRGIQKRFKEICHRRESIELVQEYMLIAGPFSKKDVVYALSGEVVVDINTVDVDINTQKKGKEKKGKGEEIKEKMSASSATLIFPSELFNRFKQVHTDCARVKDFEFQRLLVSHSNSDLQEAVESFERQMGGSSRIQFPLREFEKYLRKSETNQTSKPAPVGSTDKAAAEEIARRHSEMVKGFSKKNAARVLVENEEK